MNELAPNPIPEALVRLYAAQKVLANAFPAHTFTIDGKIIGDIGEAIAEAVFGLTKLRGGTKSHDFRADDGRLVQVKATQKGASGKSVGLGLTKATFEHLLVLEFDRDGTFEVIFKGPGSVIDLARAHKKSASLSRKQLRACQDLVPASERLLRKAARAAKIVCPCASV